MAPRVVRLQCFMLTCQSPTWPRDEHKSNDTMSRWLRIKAPSSAAWDRDQKTINQQIPAAVNQYNAGRASIRTEERASWSSTQVRLISSWIYQVLHPSIPPSLHSPRHDEPRPKGETEADHERGIKLTKGNTSCPSVPSRLPPRPPPPLSLSLSLHPSIHPSTSPPALFKGNAVNTPADAQSVLQKLKQVHLQFVDSFT